MRAGAAALVCAAASREYSSSNSSGSRAPSRIHRAIMRSIIPYFALRQVVRGAKQDGCRSEFDVLADGFDAGRCADVVFLPARRARYADPAEEGAAGLDRQATADGDHIGPIAQAALRPARLRGLGERGGIGAKARRGVGLRARQLERVRPREAVAQQHLQHAHAVDHRDRGLIAAVAAFLERSLRRLQRRLGREHPNGKGRLGRGEWNREDDNRGRGDGSRRPHFFFMKKVYSRLASSCDSSSWPVWRAKVWKSFTDPGSVASTFSTCPERRSVSAFFVRRMGSGQFSPRASSSLSKVMGGSGEVTV